MITGERIESVSVIHWVTAKAKDYLQLYKLRLSLLVVFSAVIGYVLGAETVVWRELLLLITGGFLVTGASNAFNQIIEKDTDALMERTKKRPLAAGRMGVREGLIFATISGIAGISILYFGLNPLSGLLGTLALLLYAAIYTPLKKITPLAVLVGAFPGAIPPMLGWVAATGKFGLGPGILFAVQFIWQFPHFWSIAWSMNDDYSKAGFKLLPSTGGRDKSSAFQILVYSLFMVPASLLPAFFGITGLISAIIAFAVSSWWLFEAWKLFRTCSNNAAKRVMFASFIYLPVILLAYIFDKL